MRDICALAPAGALIWINRDRSDIGGQVIGLGQRIALIADGKMRSSVSPGEEPQ